MWSKKKLEAFVVMTILVAVVLTTLRVVVLVNYKAGALLLFISSLVKMVISYLNTRTIDLRMRYVFAVASLSFIGSCLDAFSYYWKASSTSYVISSNLQYLFTALMSAVLSSTRYSSTQCFGLLMVLVGLLVEISSAETPSDIPIHMFLGSMSGLFNAVSLFVFEWKIKPKLVDFASLWRYMTAYGLYLTLLSLLFMAEEVVSRNSDYIRVAMSPAIYLIVLIEVAMAYILSEVSPFLDTVERSTLVNVITGLSAVVADLYMSREMDAQQFLGFSFSVIGVQVFNFFWKETVHPLYPVDGCI